MTTYQELMLSVTFLFRRVVCEVYILQKGEILHKLLTEV